ncbi:MAG: hypothetical protein KGV56_06670 [Gammaproteobacteria bacterium]|nr:hypothetical protein [Gammaproteobacteria bacterium]
MKTPKKSIRKTNNRAYSHIIRIAQSAIKNNYPDGLTGFANDIGEKPSTIRNQFNPIRPEQPTFCKFLQAIEMTQDSILMNAICSLANGRFVLCDDDAEAGELIPSLLHFASIASDNIHTVLQALEDGRISQAERIELQALIKEQRQALAELSASLGGSDD